MRPVVLGWAMCLWAMPVAGSPSKARPVRALFVGNSLMRCCSMRVGGTSRRLNDVLGLVERMARARGQAIHVRPMVVEGSHLADHFDRVDVGAVLAEGWDHVLLQPGRLDTSDRLAAAKVAMLRFRRGQPRARWHLYHRPSHPEDPFRTRARTAALATWAKAEGFSVIPAQAAWRALKRSDLFSDDRVHPRALGSYASAALILRTFFPRLTLGSGQLGRETDLVRALNRAQEALGELPVRGSLVAAMAEVRRGIDRYGAGRGAAGDASP